MKYDVDDREFLVPGYDAQGTKLNFEVYEALLNDVQASDAHTEQEIKAFCAGWLARLKSEAAEPGAKARSKSRRSGNRPVQVRPKSA